jgi:signal transduction histidine kinase
MDEVERKINNIPRSEGAAGRPERIAKRLPEEESGLLRHLQETEEIIRRRIESETLLIDDLRDLARMQRPNFELRMSRVDMHEVTAHAVNRWQKELDGKQLEVTLELHAASADVRGDHHRLQQVVANLVRNAIRFTPPYGTIQIATENYGRFLQIAVVDDGVGIELEALPYVFGMFESGTTDLHSASEGASLQVCKTLVKLQGGDISVLSRGLGTGATFTISLPILR